jgi:hypothetical protein
MVAADLARASGAAVASSGALASGDAVGLVLAMPRPTASALPSPAAPVEALDISGKHGEERPPPRRRPRRKEKRFRRLRSPRAPRGKRREASVQLAGRDVGRTRSADTALRASTARSGTASRLVAGGRRPHRRLTRAGPRRWARCRRLDATTTLLGIIGHTEAKPWWLGLAVQLAR